MADLLSPYISSSSQVPVSFGRSMASLCKSYPLFLEKSRIPTRRTRVHCPQTTRCTPRCVLGITVQTHTENLYLQVTNLQESFNTSTLTMNDKDSMLNTPYIFEELNHRLLLMELDPATAKLVIPLIGPFLSAFAFLFIARIVMSWYPKLPVGKFPYVLAYAPTEPLLGPTRKVIRPIGGVDITPVVWFGLISFLNEILVGPQGLLVLLSQQV